MKRTCVNNNKIKINKIKFSLAEYIIITIFSLVISITLLFFIVFQCVFLTDNLILWSNIGKFDFISSGIGNGNFKGIFNIGGTSDTTSNIIDMGSSEALESSVSDSSSSSDSLQEASENTKDSPSNTTQITRKIEATIPKNGLSVDLDLEEVDLENLYKNINSYYNITNSPDITINSSILEKLTQNIDQYENFLEYFDELLNSYEDVDIVELSKDFGDVRYLQKLISKEGLESANTISHLIIFLRNRHVKALIDKFFMELYKSYKPELLEENTIQKYIVQLLKVNAFLDQLIEQSIKLNKELDENYNISEDKQFRLDFIFKLKTFSKFKMDYRKLIVDFKDISNSNLHQHGGIASGCYMYLTKAGILITLRLYDEIKEEEIVRPKYEDEYKDRKSCPDDAGLEKASPFLFYNYLLRLKYFVKNDEENTSKVKFLFKNLNICRYNFGVDLLRKKQANTKELFAAGEKDLLTKQINERFVKDALLCHIKKTIIASKIYEIFKKKESKLKTKNKNQKEKIKVVKYYEKRGEKGRKE